MKTLLCIIGTRPQLIKHSVLLPELEKRFRVYTINTLQHYDADLNENIISNLFRADMISISIVPGKAALQRLYNMVESLSTHIKQVRPDAVVLYGDTDTTLAGTLAAKKNNIKLIHVEAGERSYNIEMPEEQNRLITDSLADILFCSSERAMENLKKEEHRGEICYTGDVMKDLLLKKEKSETVPITNEKYVFFTLHRNYNQKNTKLLASLLGVLSRLEHKVIFAVHPATSKTLDEMKIHRGDYKNIYFRSPVNYSQSINYQKFALAVITDSGGMQKEAYWLKIPCITVRTETEWKETLKGNWNQLVYDDPEQIPLLLQKEKTNYDPSLYGSGDAALKISEKIFIHL
jgi:UDP-GlcNAc3NAcA epimerase